MLALLVAGSCTPQVIAGNVGSSSPAASASPESSPSVKPPPAPDSLRAPAPGHVDPPPEKDGLPSIVSQIDTKDRVVFMTIDDGYTKDQKVLDVLRERDIPVTPFLTRAAIANDRNYFSQVVQITGQDVQNHTLTHPQLPTRGSAGQKSEICGTEETYKEWFGKRPWMLRPPYGEWNRETQVVAGQCGIDYIVMWSVSLPTSQLRYQVGNKLRPGDVILTHWTPSLGRYLPSVLDDIKKQGFKIAALQDYLPAR